jgi:antitoxin VapB
VLFAPIAHIEAIDRAELNRLLSKWEHKMGPMTRPSYAIEAHHALFEHGTPVALTATGEPIGQVVGSTGIRRDQCVELTRLCAVRRDLCRPMLRLWREMIFPHVAAAHGRDIAVSYQDESLHTGDTYRFDGWLLIGTSASGTDRRSGRPGRKKKIWAWPTALAAELLAASQPQGAAE